VIECVASLGAQLRMLKARILEFDRLIMAWHRSNEASKRLDEIPGVGAALATALVASVADPKAFRSGRNFSAWIGLVPKQYSSGGKDKLGSISKQGDRYLRSLFTAGALAVIRYAKIHGTKHPHDRAERHARSPPARACRNHRAPAAQRTFPNPAELIGIRRFKTIQDCHN
jgi:transposase